LSVNIIKKTKSRNKKYTKVALDNDIVKKESQIYFNILPGSKKKNKKNSKLFYSHFQNSFFFLNNLGNFYKQNKKYEEAIKCYVIALKKKNDILNLSADLKKITKKNNLIKSKTNYLELIGLLNNIIISLKAKQLVTISRPHFSEAYTLIDKLIPRIEILKMTIIKNFYSNKFKFIKLKNFLKNEIGKKLRKPNYDNVFYNLGFCYQKINKINKAIKYYKLANKSEDSHRYNHNLLECFYLSKNKKQFINLCKKMKSKKVFDFNSYAISNYASNQLNINNNYKFCKDPINCVSNFDLIRENILDSYDLQKIEKDILKKTNKVNTPVVKGFKSLGNLYDIETTSINNLKKIIRKYINKYKKNFKDKNSTLIKNWPKKYVINAWYIRLKSGGEVLSHIHDGWLSGVLYIKKIDKKKIHSNTEGELEVNYRFSNLKEFKKNFFKKIVFVNEGNLVLFPSSLPHRVIPYKGHQERLSIAFDMKPLR
jgi:uncharacterized protein (TIGR02466 family)